MSDAKPPANPPAPVDLDLEWEGERRFRGRAGAVEIVMDSAAQAGPTPVQALAFALAGCMAIDLVHILTRARHTVFSLVTIFTGERAPEEPHRFVKIDLRFSIATTAPAEQVQRALDLSRNKYCSVWNSLRQDIEFNVGYELNQEEPGV